MNSLMNFIEQPENIVSGSLICFALLAVGILLLVRGGGWLVKGGLGVAKAFKIKTVIIGLTIIAFSTSSPELAFNVFAAGSGHGEITIGNIFGSNIANLALVLGIGALIHNRVLRNKRKKSISTPPDDNVGTPIPKRIRTLIGWWLVGSTLGISIIAASIILWSDQLSWLKLDWRWGIAILVIFVFFFWSTNIKKDSQRKGSSDDEKSVKHACSLPWAIVYLFIGIISLGIGGKAAEIAAVSGARIMGISEMFIGVTIVAIATSLPELVTTCIAARKDQAHLAWGNIFGSNLFNIMFVLPITMIVVGVPWFRTEDAENYIPLPDTSDLEPWIYMGIMVVITLITFGMIRKGKDLTNFEGYSLLGMYLTFLIGITVWKLFG